jgi:hypothetical protein
VTNPQQRRFALPSPAQLRTTGRVAVTVTALASVSAGVVAVTGVGRSDGAGLVEADVARAASAQGPVEPADTSKLRAAQGSARQRVEAERARAEAERGRVAAAARAARERQQTAARNAVRDPRGAARAMLADRGWSGGQFSCLDSLWTKESGWNPRARNPSSGAFGIPQALPAGKMSSAGADWATNPVTQIRWGLQYIADVYGSPCGAWAHSRATNWY